MKNIVLGLICLVSSFAIAQTKMTTTEAAAFKKEVQSEAGKTTSITADFEETKHVSVLKNASTSTGIFRFKGEKLLWQYNAPKKSAMLFNKQNLKIKSEKGKISTIDLNKNKRFKQLQQLMMGSYTGNLFDETSFDITYFKNGTTRFAVLKPKSKDMSKHIKEVTLTFKNNEGTVSEIKIVESSNDYSVIKLKNKKLNTALSDSVFQL
ncbi:outer membrane lipoprotein carrier protein LolA [Flavobacterium sp. xlx-214]|uniref:LolA family protein n=1 Tax=unclassified Flavobacterium TaxID=196869 RepID=UPI0013D54B5B|nr:MULTISPECIES: outer membrane lipoprotein carrier protein LolA [unclassified Flavobacterium]MBA5792100.1 outer membrane lipoprotein carrier protein LolA [Flavobacterium sp. xlx-221]QMI84347.1 outer membrane lipoprotein carrier protein LolA [Flavobacterium sp. xlx-214]